MTIEEAKTVLSSPKGSRPGKLKAAKIFREWLGAIPDDRVVVKELIALPMAAVASCVIGANEASAEALTVRCNKWFKENPKGIWEIRKELGIENCRSTLCNHQPCGL